MTSFTVITSPALTAASANQRLIRCPVRIVKPTLTRLSAISIRRVFLTSSTTALKYFFPVVKENYSKPLRIRKGQIHLQLVLDMR